MICVGVLRRRLTYWKSRDRIVKLSSRQIFRNNWLPWEWVCTSSAILARAGEMEGNWIPHIPVVQFSYSEVCFASSFVQAFFDIVCEHEYFAAWWRYWKWAISWFCWTAVAPFCGKLCPFVSSAVDMGNKNKNGGVSSDNLAGVSSVVDKANESGDGDTNGKFGIFNTNCWHAIGIYAIVTLELN